MTADGIVLSGTGGVWQVRTDEGETHDVSLRGRLKRGTEAVKLADILRATRQGPTADIRRLAAPHQQRAVFLALDD